MKLSPSGDRAAIASGSGLVVVKLDDLRSQNVLPRPGVVAYPRWDPAGKYVAVIGNETGAFQGYRISATGDLPPEQITSQPQSVATSFSPDGRSVLGYVVTAERGRDIWLFGLDGQHTPLLESPSGIRSTTWRRTAVS